MIWIVNGVVVDEHDVDYESMSLWYYMVWRKFTKEYYNNKNLVVCMPIVADELRDGLADAEDNGRKNHEKIEAVIMTMMIIMMVKMKRGGCWLIILGIFMLSHGKLTVYYYLYGKCIIFS